MSTEERQPGAHTGPPATTPVKDWAPTNRFNYDLPCKVCGAQAEEDCRPGCGRMNSPNSDLYHTRYKTMVNGYKAPSAATPQSVRDAAPKPRHSAKNLVLAQTVGDTGFPRIEQAQLLNMPSVKALLQMLTYMRPDGSKTEEEYIKKFISDLPTKVIKDKFGNRWCWIAKPDGSKPDLIFSSHTDTVHHKEGKQTVMVGDGRAWTDEGSCLGADDTVGNWLMCEMIKAKVPGLYIFHRGEEVGGRGSSWITKNRDTLLKDKFKAVIALDRKGYHDIITHQGGRRTCSDKFAKSLNTILGAKMTPSTGGTFTDSKNYIDLVGECTNVSVGYWNQHGPTEWTELSFAVGLRDALVAADWSKLEFERKPGESGWTPYSYGQGGYSGGYSFDDWEDLGLGGHKGSHRPAAATSNGTTSPKVGKHDALARKYGQYKAESAAYEARQMMSFVRSWPDTIAHFLLEKGFTVDDIADWYDDVGNTIPGADDWDAK